MYIFNEMNISEILKPSCLENKEKDTFVFDFFTEIIISLKFINFYFIFFKYLHTDSSYKNF